MDLKEAVKRCVEQINSSPSNISLKKLDKNISNYFKKVYPEKQSERVSTEKIEVDERYLVQKDRFVPSAKLLESYQQLYKTSINPIEKVIEPQNPRVSLFQKTFTSVDANKVNWSKPQTNLNNFVEQRQQAILSTLKDGRLAGTLQIMEETLMQNELRNLERKEIKMENVRSLEQWKKKRALISQQLS